MHPLPVQGNEQRPGLTLLRLYQHYRSGTAEPAGRLGRRSDLVGLQRGLDGQASTSEHQLGNGRSPPSKHPALQLSD